MNEKELIEELLADLCILHTDGLPNLQSDVSISYISEFFNKRGMWERGQTLIENLFEDDKQFKNPELNKVISYKTVNGDDAEGKVGNLLRRPDTEDAYKKAVATLGGEDSDSYKKAMDDLGGEGQPDRDIEGEREKKDDSGEAGGGEEPETGTAFDPKTKGGTAYLKGLSDTDPAKPANMKDDSEETLSAGGVVYPVGGGYYADSPGGKPKYRKATDENVDLTDFRYILEAESVVGKEVVKKVVTVDDKNTSTETIPLVVTGDKTKKKDAPPKRGKKNKKLDQTKNTKGEFNEGNLSKDGVTDEQFEANSKIKPTPSQIKVEQIDKFFLDESGNTKFPKKYIKVLARMLSTKPGGVTISDFTDASGAGTVSSTMGELLSMMSATIKDDNEAKEFFGMLREHVKKNGKDSIIDIGWVNSAEKVRKTQFQRYDRTYGKGNWELDNMAWDVEGEVEALGMENYKQNKGFSTDVYAKVKVGGEYVLDEISLKKEIKANLLNATSGRVQDIMVRGAASSEDLKRYEELNTKIDALLGLTDKNLVSERKKLISERNSIIEKYNVNVPDTAKVSYAQKKQRELHEEFIQNASTEIEEFFNNFCNKDDASKTNIATSITNKMNQKPDYTAQVTKKMNDICEGIQSGLSYENVLMKNEGKTNYQKLNLAVMIAIDDTNENSNASTSYKSIVENSHNHSKAVRKFLLEDKNARNGLFASIRDAFPLRSLFEGEENMILGDVSADRQVLQDVFGVEEFSELEQKLTIRDEPPPPSIVYRVVGPGGSNIDIPIAEISSRPDGIGYGGTWKLEMKVHDEFGKKLRESNLKLNN
jgi:hypothetical protein